ncbi:MAG: transposase [Cyanobacteria bacterium P01_D01_bin.116]
MARKQICHSEEYVTTRFGYLVEGDKEKALLMARRAGKLRKDIWLEYGSLKAWGVKADKLYSDFRNRHPAYKYGLDSKQHQKTFERVIQDIQASQSAAKSFVIKKIYKHFKPEFDTDGKAIEDTSFRKELIDSLKTLKWMQYPLIHRWVRDYYRRGFTNVNNQICVGTNGNGATVKRISRNVVKVEIRGDKIGKNKYEKIQLKFKVGRSTPTGLFQIIFDEVTEKVRLCYPKVLKKKQAVDKPALGVDKGLTEVFVDSVGRIYGDGLSKITNKAVDKRHHKGRARNKLYQIAIKTGNFKIFAANLGKKKWNFREQKKKVRATNLIRTATNKLFDNTTEAIVEDLTKSIKARGAKKRQKLRNRRANEWCKGIIQKAIEEISSRRKSSFSYVNAAFTSQVDSRYSVLLGTRNGDRFFTFDGEVIHADCNAALNIENRKHDLEIKLSMPVNQVREILVKKTAYFLSLRGFTLNDAINFGWFNREHLAKTGLEVDGFRVVPKGSRK